MLCNVTSCCYSQAAKALQDKVFQYDPRQAGFSVPKFNILLFGGVGAGKSSMFSTIDSISQGRTSRRAQTGQGSGSLTLDLSKYKLAQPGTKERVKWELWDSMGWGTDDYKKGELGFILDGNLPNNCRLGHDVSTKIQGFKAHPSLEDRVHCVILVVPCHAATDDTYLTRLREMRQIARDRSKHCLYTQDTHLIGLLVCQACKYMLA